MWCRRSWQAPSPCRTLQLAPDHGLLGVGPTESADGQDAIGTIETLQVLKPAILRLKPEHLARASSTAGLDGWIRFGQHSLQG